MPGRLIVAMSHSHTVTPMLKTSVAVWLLPALLLFALLSAALPLPAQPVQAQPFLTQPL